MTPEACEKHSPLPHPLACPACGGPWLHQGRTEVYERIEDAPSGLRVIVDVDAISITTSMEDNPSGRRQGLRLHFACEWCAADPTLVILQHKGKTFVKWERDTRTPVQAGAPGRAGGGRSDDAQ